MAKSPFRNPFVSPRKDFDTPQPFKLMREGPGDISMIPEKHTPPWDEVPGFDSPPPELDGSITPPIEGATPDGALFVHEHQDLPPHLPYQERARVLEDDYWNDDQLHGTAVPPGAPNDQPFQSGHTQITILNQSAEQGWGQDPALRWPLYPHNQGTFPTYGSGIFRRNGTWAPEKNFLQMYEVITQEQVRDMRLRASKQHRQFGAVVNNAPTVTNTWNVTPTVPLPWYSVDVGPEGVGPDW